MRIYLIRHGNRQDFDSGNSSLSFIGKKQALQTALWLKNIKFNMLLSSPTIRTLETAKFIGEKIDLKIKTNEALLERVEDKNYSPSNFEFDELNKQKGREIKKYLSKLNVKDKAKIILVTHASSIVDFLYSVIDTEKIINKTPTFLKRGKYLIPECSITIVEKDENDYSLKNFALSNHLLKKKNKSTLI